MFVPNTFLKNDIALSTPSRQTYFFDIPLLINLSYKQRLPDEHNLFAAYIFSQEADNYCSL